MVRAASRIRCLEDNSIPYRINSFACSSCMSEDMCEGTQGVWSRGDRVRAWVSTRSDRVRAWVSTRGEGKVVPDLVPDVEPKSTTVLLILQGLDVGT